MGYFKIILKSKNLDFILFCHTKFVCKILAKSDRHLWDDSDFFKWNDSIFNTFNSYLSMSSSHVGFIEATLS